MRSRHLLFSLLACAAAVAAQAAPAPLPNAPAAGPNGDLAPAHWEVEREGLRFNVELKSLESGRRPGELLEGDPVAVRLGITDVATGTAMPGLYPGGWMDLVPAGAEDGATACQDKVEAFLGGTLFAEPEVDLNVYFVVALNSDATLTVVDPIFGFGGSKLLDLVVLEAPGEDWALDRAADRLYVSMPEVGRVAVVDTATWKLAGAIDVGGLPSRLALDPRGRFLWVGDSGDGPAPGVVVVDLESRQVAARVPTGAGYHEVAFDPDGRHAFVTNRRAGTLSVLDADRLEKLTDLPVGERPVSMDVSPLSGAVYVSSASGRVTAVDLRRLEVVAVMEAEPGLGQVRIAPGGRLGFVVNPQEDLLHVFDTAVHRIVQSGEVEDRPDHLAFSDEMAYVRHLGSSTVLMVPLAAAGAEGQPLPVIDFPGGQRPYGEVTLPSPADGIVRAPGAAAVLVANPADEMIYYYKEGMAAPMGSFRNYGHEPRALLVVDRSLREGEPGRYRTAVQLRRPGRYDLALFLDSPRLFHCFPFEVRPNPELERRRRAAQGAWVEFLTEPGVIRPGEEVVVRFRLRDPESGAPRSGLRDVRVLTYLVPGTWQQRQWARALPDGVYEIRFVPRSPGAYRVQASSASQGLALNRSASLALWTEEEPVAGRSQPELRKGETR